MIDQILKQIEGAIITDEDGAARSIRWTDGLNVAQLEDYQKRLGLRLPADFGAFLRRSNGCSLFGLDIQGTTAQLLLDDRLLTFHNWGNGDFDCLQFGGGSSGVPVVFMNHGPSVIVKVAASFEEWLSKVFHELRLEGAVAHPRDYRVAQRNGVYSHVLAQLAGVDCELNRQ